MKTGISIALLAVAVVMIVGCGDGTGQSDATAENAPRLQKVSVTLDGPAGAENVGILMAKELGYFEEAGLDVWIGGPIDPSKPPEYVAYGIDELGVTQQPQLMIAQESGLPIVAVGSLIPVPAVALMWLESSGMHRISDLRGKTIAIPGVPFQEAFLASVLARSGLSLGDVEVKKVGFGLVPSLLGGKADAIFGGTLMTDRVELVERGAKLVIPAIRSLGLPEYQELVIIAKRDLASKDPRLVREFMAAVVRGNDAARQDPERAAKVIFDNGEANPSIDLATIEAQVQTAVPLLSTNGQIEPAQEQALRAWMRKEGMFK